jgi:hypothetical protein
VWNIPLLLTLLEYQFGYSKLFVMQYTGLKIALWDERTESAIRMIYWTYHNPWLFPVVAIVANLTFVLTRSGGRWFYLRWSTFAVLLALSLWYASQAEYLDNKVLGMP